MTYQQNPGQDFRAGFPTASLELDYVVQNPALIRQNNEFRGADIAVDDIVRLGTTRRDLTRQVDAIRQELNSVAKKGKPDPAQIEHIKGRKAELKNLETALATVQVELAQLFDQLPNLTHPDVPSGGADANLVVRQMGNIRKFDFDVLPHHIIGTTLDLLDFERGAKIAGSGFYYLKNQLLLMRYALVMMFFGRTMDQGFVPMNTPLVANRTTLYGTGYFPFATKDNFKLDGQDLLLIGTSEQTLVGQHADEILKTLPLKYVADTACFRTEAGSYGRNVQGMIRVHQFGKVEQIVFCRPEESEAMQNLCLENEEWLLQQLNIPYQVVLIAAGDMGAPGYKKYDLEGWFPSQGRFIELTSNTNLTDFQTRRLGVRFRDGKERLVYPHTISATGFSDRLIAAIVENYQDEKGGIVVPPALRPFMGGLERIS